MRPPGRSGSPQALELARRCGAIAIAKRADPELEATGERIDRLTLLGPGSLTPSERRIAAMDGGGRTNRDVAQDLFLAVKTARRAARRLTGRVSGARAN